MRTTLTIDDDIAREVEARMRRDGMTLKAVVNDLLRKGLQSGDRPAAQRPPVTIETFASPFAPGIDIAKLNQLNDELEVAELFRKHGSSQP